MAHDWNGDGKISHADRAMDYALFEEICNEDKNGGNGKKPDDGGGCGTIIGIGLFIFVILLIF